MSPSDRIVKISIRILVYPTGAYEFMPREMSPPDHWLKAVAEEGAQISYGLFQVPLPKKKAKVRDASSEV